MPHLPDELWLHILAYLPPADIWRTLHPLSRQLSACTEDYLVSPHCSNVLSRFTVGHQFSLSSGSHHRWYDVRGTITFTFKGISKHNARYAWFGSYLVHPQRCNARAMEEWKRMSERGVSGRQEWRVQFGYDGDVRLVRLPKLVLLAGEEGVWVDWREMFDAYFAPKADEEGARQVVWSSRAN